MSERWYISTPRLHGRSVLEKMLTLEPAKPSAWLAWKRPRGRRGKQAKRAAFYARVRDVRRLRSRLMSFSDEPEKRLRNLVVYGTTHPEAVREVANPCESTTIRPVDG